MNTDVHNRIDEYVRSQLMNMTSIPASQDINDDALSRTGSTATDIDKASVAKLRSLVKKWTELDETTKRMSRLIRVNNALKKDLEEQILGFMGDNDIQQLHSQSGLITAVNKKVKKRMPKSAMIERIQDEIQDPDTRRKVLGLLKGDSVTDSNESKAVLKRIAL